MVFIWVNMILFLYKWMKESWVLKLHFIFSVFKKRSAITGWYPMKIRELKCKLHSNRGSLIWDISVVCMHLKDVGISNNHVVFSRCMVSSKVHWKLRIFLFKIYAICVNSIFCLFEFIELIEIITTWQIWKASAVLRLCLNGNE